MSVKLNSSSGGSVTLQEPTTASNFTLTLPAQTATVITDSSAILNIGSGQIYKDASGNVGIGSTSASGRLHVRQDQDGTTRSILHNRNSSGTPLVELDFITGAVDLSDNRYAYIQSGGGSSQYIAFGTGQGASPTERARIDSSGNWYMNSGYGSVAVAYGCRAWVNYNATGSSTRASGGLSSVTKNGTGDYTLNFSNTMPDTNYSVVATANAYNNYQGLVVCIQSMSTTSVNLRNTQGNNASAAEGNISGGAASVLCVSIFR